MDSNTAQIVRNTLASNFDVLTSTAMHGANFPRQIKIERLEHTEVRVIGNANFAFQIGAIDGETYCNLRNLVLDVTDSVEKLRKVYTAKNYLCAQAQAIIAARRVVGEKVTSLCAALDKMKHGDASTPDTAATTQIILTSGLVNA